MEQAVDWAANTDPAWPSRARRVCDVTASGPWGREVQLFYGRFFGLGFEVAPGATHMRAPDARPYARA